jgi:hypothetical protein
MNGRGEHMQHPPWLVAPAVHAELDCDVGKVYGEEFSQFLPPRPASAFLAEGSEVAVSRGVRVAH